MTKQILQAVLGLGNAWILTEARRASAKSQRPGGLVEVRVVERGDSLPNRQLVSVLASEPEWCCGTNCCGTASPQWTHRLGVQGARGPEFVLAHAMNTAPEAAAV